MATLPRRRSSPASPPPTPEEATRMLGTLPEQAVVIEDAISGVQAGGRAASVLSSA